MLREILSQYNITSPAEPYGNGLINSTYIIHDKDELLLQKINAHVFKNPEQVMENIAKVTSFMRQEILSVGGNPDRETLNVIKTKDGNDFYKTASGDYYRMYRFITDTYFLDLPEKPEDLYNAGAGFGKFARLLDKFDINSLHETIVDFHNTEKRYENFEASLNKDAFDRAKEVAELIEFVNARKNYTSVVMRELRSGGIPLRVTHNDSKLNNILFDNKTKKPICVIDLDTVMPGSLLFDFGDANRVGSNNGKEDDQNLDNVFVNLDMYNAFKNGYLSDPESIITAKEKELLPFSCILMTFECGMRFLTDYLDGDIYFKTLRDKHNIDRAKAQFKLVSDMERAFNIKPTDF